MDSSLLYRLVRLLGYPFRYRVVGLDKVQDAGPALFVANHLGSAGPLAVILSLPLRLYPWVIAEMADYRRAARYLFDDFVRPELGLDGRFGLALSWLISRLAVALIRGVGCVPVERWRGQPLAAFKRSLELLARGESLLIFPEDAEDPAVDAESGMHPFQDGFAALCRMYYHASGRRLPVYPLAVHPPSRTVALGEPLFMEKHGGRQDVELFRRRVQQRVAAIYRTLGTGARLDHRD